MNLLVMITFVLWGSVGFAQTNASNLEKYKDEVREAMKHMDSDMSTVPMTDDIDSNFARMMIPHHQGAIDMAKMELIYGKDPLMQRLAQEIIVEQQSEIDLMNLWIKRHTEDK